MTVKEMPQPIQALAKEVFGENSNYTITDWDLDRVYINKDGHEHTIRMWNITEEEIRWTSVKYTFDDNGVEHREELGEGIFDYAYEAELEQRRNQTSDFSLTEVEDEMNQSEYVSLVMNFLKDEILDCIDASENWITVDLRDCNFEVNGVNWHEALQEHLSKYNYSVRFTGGDGHWSSVHLN